ncbi:glucose-1-phosphate cytidylyltransferase [Candidatus Roizmanbacteria bacterium CG03_land_8_20_14_0_80_39_12]|uniref:Glucose-1-phosphate cytidylyltransferase n=2 Tax=Candidatus Roizmaniibacteriota TaxID=1752723 RepID=A0A2M7BQX4_9BACT|nr:MAG: glucose-1-phosphate cytidylyltransferase [Candidatus Roizmanbacteria bacterium CG03_land_8_20_14_0_80_39_12]
MKVIILCGGEGTRLKEETEYKPKPMVLVGGKPIIWHIMKLYSSFGFREFLLALGYKSEYIKEYFLNQKAITNDFTLETKNHKTTFHLENKNGKDNFKITFVDTGLTTLPGERILLCEKYIPKKDREFMVTYGDGVTDLSIKKLFAFHKKQKTLGTITGVHPRSKYGLVQIASDSTVKSFIEKPVLSDWVNGGYMIFKRTFFKYLEKGETEHVALKKLAKIHQLSLYRHEGFWMSVDTHKELDDMNKIWKESAPWKVWS